MAKRRKRAVVDCRYELPYVLTGTTRHEVGWGKTTASAQEIRKGFCKIWVAGLGIIPATITKVYPSPKCERCHEYLLPDTTFDAGTGHWEPCSCPSWKTRAIVAEEKLRHP